MMTVLITGASSGIGAAVVRQLLADGWQVIGMSRSLPPFSQPNFRHLMVDVSQRSALLAALDAAGLTDRVDAIHLDDLSRLTMDYAGRFSVEMEYNADYDRMLQILEAGISKLESNQTGSIRLDLNPPILTLD